MGRWTDIAPWIGPLVNSGDGDGRELEPADAMSDHMGLVVHTAEGSYDGTIAWQRNPAADVGSHFLGAKDGRRAQLIDTRDRSWCQSGGNSTWVSLENEGHGSRGEALTEPQCQFAAELLARLHVEDGVPLQVSNSPTVRGLGWHGMGGAAWGGHYDCPGDAIRAQLPAIVARAAEIINGGTTTMTTLREDPDGKYLYPRVDATANLLDVYPPGPEQGHGVPLTALLKELRDNGRYVYPRMDAVANLLDDYTLGPEVGEPVPLVALLRQIAADAEKAAEATPVTMTDVDQRAIADLVTAGILADLQPLIDLARKIGNG